MSLWTPGGEHEVPKDDGGGTGAPSGAPGAAGAPGQPPLTPEQEQEAQQIAAEMAEVRAQLGQVPAAQVVANHAMGLWELAAIHLSAQPPKFEEAQLAIDAFGALTEVLTGRLGEDEATLADALAQLRLAFVQMKASYGTAPAGTAPAENAAAPETAEEPGDD